MARRAARARSALAETRRRGGAGRAGRGCRCTAAASAAPWCRPHAAGEHAERRCQEPPQRGRLGRRGCDHRWQDESKRSQRKLRRSAGEGRIQRMRFLTRKSLRRPTKRKNFPLRGPLSRDPFMNVRPRQVPNRVAPRCRYHPAYTDITPLTPISPPVSALSVNPGHPGDRGTTFGQS